MKCLGSSMFDRIVLRPTAPHCRYHRRRMLQEEVVAKSLEKRCTAADEKASLDMAQELLVSSPPVMAYVPDRWPDGRAKDVCGWQVGVVWYASFSQRCDNIVAPGGSTNRVPLAFP